MPGIEPRWPNRYHGRAMAQAVSRRSPHRGDPGSSPAQSMFDLWWTKWYWDRFFPEYFGFPLSITFHRCSITNKRTKTPITVTILTELPLFPTDM
jgi:hypothetical protein